MRRIASALLVTIAASCAADGDSPTVLADLRFGIGGGPLPTSNRGVITESTSPSFVCTTYEERFSRNIALALSGDATFGTLDPIGVVYGLGVRSTTGEVNTNEIVTDGTSYSLREYSSIPSQSYSDTALLAHVGVGARLSAHWHTEMVGFAGANWVQLDQIAINAENENELILSQATGNGQTIGLRSGWYWTADAAEAIQVGFVLEISRMRADLTNDYLADKTATEITVQGFGARAVIGYRF
jgi:hypothetical protein